MVSPLFDSILRILIAILLFVSAGLVIRESFQLHWSREHLQQLQMRQLLLKDTIDMNKKYAANVRELNPRTLHMEARKRRYLLPGEIDWDTLERMNALKWPEFWQKSTLLEENP